MEFLEDLGKEWDTAVICKYLTRSANGYSSKLAPSGHILKELEQHWIIIEGCS